eukprot:2219652-Pyramimonas_sp.AAC.1
MVHSLWRKQRKGVQRNALAMQRTAMAMQLQCCNATRCDCNAVRLQCNGGGCNGAAATGVNTGRDGATTDGGPPGRQTGPARWKDRKNPEVQALLGGSDKYPGQGPIPMQPP